MLQLYDKHACCVARGDGWSVSFVQFCLHGDIDINIYIITRSVFDNSVSELFHFSSVAKRTFLRYIAEFQALSTAKYIVECVDL